MVRGLAKIALLSLFTLACDGDEQEADVQHTEQTPGPLPADAPTDAGHAAPAADTGHVNPAPDSVAASTTH